MELRSTRSRSKTPAHFSVGFEEKISESNNHFETVTRTTRKSTVKSFENYTQSEISQTSKPMRIKNKKEASSTQRRKYLTSDYSSEDGEYEVSSTKHITQNTKNQFIEDNAIKANGNGEFSALKVYKELGEYWNKFPKTDYTYSRHSKDRIELAPGVVCMPNMSRHSIYTISHKETNTDEASYLSENQNFVPFAETKLQPKKLFVSEYDDSQYSSSSSSSSWKNISVIRRITTIISTILTTMFSWVYTGYKTQNSWLLWIASGIHRFVSKVMLLDCLILKGGDKKTSSIMKLCLIPPILFGGWLLLSGLGHILGASYLNTTTTDHQLYQQPIQTPFNVEDIRENIDAINVGKVNSGIVSESKQEPQILPPIIQEKVIKITERIQLEPPSALEIASKLTSEQLMEIASLVSASIDTDSQLKVKQEEIVSRILSSPDILDMINKYNSLNAAIVSHGNTDSSKVDSSIINHQNILINNLKDEINKVKLDLLNLEQKRSEEIARLIVQLRTENIHNNARLHYEIKKCCRTSFVYIEGYISKILRNILGVPPEYGMTQNDISKWLHSIFVAKQDLEEKLSNSTATLTRNFDTVIEDNSKLLMEEVSGKILMELTKRIQKLESHAVDTTKVTGAHVKLDSISDVQIKAIVEETLDRYDADKTGLVDYAMEPSGGQVVSTRCTESYQAGVAVFSIFGIPLWYTHNTPRTVITPRSVRPGECWAFQNFPGFLVIKLAAPIKIEAFSYEHVSKHLIPNGKIDSAPKEFHVYGLMQEDDKNATLIGEYVYDYDGKPLQFFAAENHGLTFKMIEIRIISNHGNPNYTCMYRFRVHGKLSAEPT